MHIEYYVFVFIYIGTHSRHWQLSATRAPQQNGKGARSSSGRVDVRGGAILPFQAPKPPFEADQHLHVTMRPSWQRNQKDFSNSSWPPVSASSYRWPDSNIPVCNTRPCAATTLSSILGKTKPPSPLDPYVVGHTWREGGTRASIGISRRSRGESMGVAVARRCRVLGGGHGRTRSDLGFRRGERQRQRQRRRSRQRQTGSLALTAVVDSPTFPPCLRPAG
ncbi:uncharacterized protein LY79DRAFT_155418 [Colletotrichum navitas]|uniref:Uncharacterized protein n=1 Tax=Colletotrichum navitas TaxID=681940 RepID=A0AAD8Q3Y4_9PEZI|nr:uncharacterized protein LY79DRAFT_155418 [Colletotrichum navitas]KAK1594389.1 hypothetical protein LY79DRAFT_155418 [Colletotrichum navitas]